MDGKVAPFLVYAGNFPPESPRPRLGVRENFATPDRGLTLRGRSFASQTSELKTTVKNGTLRRPKHDKLQLEETRSTLHGGFDRTCRQ